MTSLSSPIHENSNSKKPTSFDAQSATSSDSDLELVSQTPPVVAAASAANANGTSTGISRAKILESVGVIVKNSSSAANLLLPPSSSSPTSSSSVSVYEAGNVGCGNEEPRLAFIGCETTLSSPSHSLSGHHHGGAMPQKRPSLSERYPTSPSTSTTSSKKSNIDDDNLDIISIITDGMT